MKKRSKMERVAVGSGSFINLQIQIQIEFQTWPANAGIQPQKLGLGLLIRSPASPFFHAQWRNTMLTSKYRPLIMVLLINL